MIENRAAHTVDMRGTAEEKFVLRIKKLYQKALNSVNGQKNNASGQIQYRIETLPDGEEITVIDTEQDVFDGKPVQTYSAIARKVLLEKFKGQVLPLGENDLVRFKAKQAEEYTYPSNPIDVHTLEYEGKMRAAPELNNLFDTAEYSHWAKDQKNHAVATLGFDYYKVKFIAGGHLFDGFVNIANLEKGRLFYDITKIKEIPASSGKYATLLAQSTSTFGNLNNISISKQ
ncbi:MAG: hypothetical protein Q4A63_08140 [Butyricicoccus pullicaecorum]|nr:hypothetical protein [Butyricicoccus pullicaecorum]MDO4669774.1 hypothetical protein [Butyricicoccus pullicaecorum]